MSLAFEFLVERKKIVSCAFTIGIWHLVKKGRHQSAKIAHSLLFRVRLILPQRQNTIVPSLS